MAMTTGENCVVRSVLSIESEDDLRRIMMALTKLLVNPLQATILPNSQKKVNVHMLEENNRSIQRYMLMLLITNRP